MSRPRAALVTLGCKVNYYDSCAVAEQLRQVGFDVVEPDQGAQVYIVNTCAVTAEAQRKSRQQVRRLIGAHPGAAIIATGCAAQLDAQQLLAIPGVAAVHGTGERANLGELAMRVYAGARAQHAVAPLPQEYEELGAPEQMGHTRATLKIQDGCDAFCTYCIIPHLRGQPRSRPVADIARETQALAQAGFAEVVLTGINLSRYGADLAHPAGLLDAVHAAAQAGIARIRLGSLEPGMLTDELLGALAGIPQVCEHFHISLQSGCDGTLARMGRGYTTAQCAAELMRIRRYFPGAGIGCDVIVGFPGETEAEFAQSVTFVEQCGFAHAHVFAYSRRPGTPAARMPGQLPNAQKRHRAAQMSQAAARSAQQYRRGLLGTTCQVLFEEPASTDGLWQGYARNYVQVYAPATGDLRGSLLPVHLEKITGDAILGTIQASDA